MARRNGNSVALLAIVVSMAAVGVVVMALSNRIDSLRSRHIRRGLARQAEGIADSAIAECLDDFSKVIEQRVSRPRMVDHLKAAARGGLVQGSRVLGTKLVRYRAERTEKLLREEIAHVSVGQVEMVPLYYSLVQNYGEVELTAEAGCASAGVYRRVTGRYYMTVDSDGLCRVNALPIRVGVFRSDDR